MKKNKEYPATHSMDTAWFAVDLDGNVAIFQFEEDGPGPIPFTDVHTDELIPILGEKKDGIAYMPFTKEQVDELKKGLKEVRSIENIRYGCNIQIKPDKKDAIEKAGARFDLCYSKADGFYHLDYFDEIQEDAIAELIKDGAVLGAQECNIELYFEDWRKDQSEHRLAHFPFFVYEQGACDYPPERMVAPHIPMKEEQLSEKAKKYTLKLPVRFAEKEYVEPAEFVDSQCWSFNNHTKEVNGITYMQVALTDGGYGYVKVVPHSFDQTLTEEWITAPRVIDKSEKYIDN